MDNKILELKSISKTFGKTKALDNVDFDLYPGEIHCLVGENGAGKSTLIKILSGAETPDHGEIKLFSESYNFLTPNQAIEQGVATIYQDIELIESLTVADNIFLGNEKKDKYAKIDFKYQNKKARELMDSINIKISAAKKIEELSASDKQTLQIVKALHIDAKILIMDEPTASLGIEESQALMNLIRKLASQGIGIIYISHYLEEVFEIGDRITVLKDGEKMNTFEAAKVELDEITTSMIGRERNQFFQREKIEKGEVILSVKNLNLKNYIEDISFELRKGEILGFGGIVGAGRTELMNTIFGVTSKDSGIIEINQQQLNIASPRHALDNGIAMIPEDRVELGLFNLRSILENIAIISNQDTTVYINHEKEKKLVQKMIDTLNIVTEGFEKAAGYLSGGNQQKTVIARWLLSNADIFIFDEPTKGVDIGAKEQIYNLITELAKDGKGILMVSSDMPELISMSDRIAVMREQKLVDIIPAQEVEEHQLLEIFLGIENNGGNNHAKTE
jgi:ribose transport system ATP-binding protein